MEVIGKSRLKDFLTMTLAADGMPKCKLEMKTRFLLSAIL